MQTLLQTLIQPNGSGTWIPGYLPTRLSTGVVLLHSKHCIVTEQPASFGTVPITAPQQLAHAGIPAQSTAQPASANAGQSNNPSPPVPGLSAQYTLAVAKQYDHVLQETAVRVVELQQHSLGARGLIAVVEVVHNRAWSAIRRYVESDVYKVCLAVQAAGQAPHVMCSCFEVYDQLVSCFIFDPRQQR
jgi:hypothetical protein